MTRDDVVDVLSIVQLKWPHSNLGALEETVAGWLDELAAFERSDVEDAVRRLVGTGREHAPGAGLVAQSVRVAGQGEPPSFDELQAWIGSHTWLLGPAHDPSGGPERTAVAVAGMEAAGAHEAVLRFVVAQGAHTVRVIPDASWQPLGLGPDATRRDFARDYAQRIVPGWRGEPQRGLALERACRAAELDPGELRELAADARRRLAGRRRAVAALGAGELAAEEAMVDVDFGELMADARRVRSSKRAAEAREREAARQVEAAESRAAERELAEHAARRTGGETP